MNNPIRSFNNHHKMFGSLEDYIQKSQKPDIFECPVCKNSFEPKQCEVIDREPKYVLYCPHCSEKLQQCDNGFEKFENRDVFDDNLCVDTEYVDNYDEEQMNNFIKEFDPKGIALIYITTEAPEIDLKSKLDSYSPDYDKCFADEYDATINKFNDLCCKEQYFNTPGFYNKLHSYVNENLDLDNIFNKKPEDEPEVNEAFDEEESEDDYTMISSKRIPDSDGFMTEYSLYKDNSDGSYFCMFGDAELYGPDPDNADMNFDSYDEAIEWFDNYEGFVDEEEDSDDESLEEAVSKKGPGAFTIMFFHDDDTFTGMMFAKDEETARSRFAKWCPSCTIDRIKPGVLSFDSYTITPDFEEQMGWAEGEYEEPIEDEEPTELAVEESVDKEPLVETDLHPMIKKQIKNDYKAWDAHKDAVEAKRDELLDLVADAEDQEKARKLIDKIQPAVDDYKFDFPKSLEKGNFPFYVTYYAEYPIYEPAEGGYYYAGCDAIHSAGFNSYEEAKAAIDEYVNENAEEDWQEYTDGYIIRDPHGYVGGDEFLVVEPNNAYLSEVRGKVPYC